jgi:hypothetical protein
MAAAQKESDARRAQHLDGFYELRLVRSSSACPEQYDCFIDNEQAGYFRLRHGRFRVDYPDCGGPTIYSADTKGDGEFEEGERAVFLARGLQRCISAWRLGAEKLLAAEQAAAAAGLR